jgi:hypothetical protein
VGEWVERERKKKEEKKLRVLNVYDWKVSMLKVLKMEKEDWKEFCFFFWKNGCPLGGTMQKFMKERGRLKKLIIFFIILWIDFCLKEKKRKMISIFVWIDCEKKKEIKEKRVILSL